MQARQPLTVWLKIAGGASVVAAVAVALWRISIMDGIASAEGTAGTNHIHDFGTTVFGKMNLFIFIAIWVFVPLATADAVSRERREGTLPLLYLTELKSLGIVVGKTFVHTLRSVSIFLAMAPWLLLPLVFGGVGLRDIAMAVMLDSASVLLAQAAGLLASTIPRDWLKSAILSLLFALMLLLIMLRAHGAILRAAAAGASGPSATPRATGAYVMWKPNFGSEIAWELSEGGLLGRTLRLIEFTTNGGIDSRPRYLFTVGSGNRLWGGFEMESNWQKLWAGLGSQQSFFWFRGVAGIVIGAVLAMVAAVWLATWRIERSWRDAPVPESMSALRQKYLSPRLGVAFLRRRLARSLTANPIGWLHHYSPSARMVKWGWCFFIIMVEIIVSSSTTDLYEAQGWLGIVLLLGLIFSATGSFREELQTGAFELLLVTPIRERQIISGRVRGLWRQFLPAVAVYGAGSIYLASGWSSGYNYARAAWMNFAAIMVAFCLVPLVGLYFSVLRWNFFVAWVVASMVAFLPRWLGWAIADAAVPMFLGQIIIAAAAALLLERRLRKRQFLVSAP
jgi:ABC-type transport system involved in multi-copper enzyme maturation permease subunit